MSDGLTLIIGIIGILIVLSLAIWITIFWIFMLVDCAKRKFKKEIMQPLWIFIMVLTGILGAIIYYFVVKKEDKKVKKK